MTTRPRLRTVLACALLLSPSAHAQDDAAKPASPASPAASTPDLSMTIYPHGGPERPAVVRQRLSPELAAGDNTLELAAVPRTLLPVTLSLRAVGGGGAVRLTEARMDYGLASPEALLRRFVGREVLINRRVGTDARTETVNGKLVSFDDGFFTIMTNNRQLPLQLIPRGGDILEIKLVNPGPLPGVATRLVYKVYAEEAGTRPLELTYLAAGTSWAVDYQLLLRDGETADLGALVTLSSSTGVTLPPATIELARDGGAPAIRLARPVAVPESGPVQASLFEPQKGLTYVRENVLYTGGRPGAQAPMTNGASAAQVHQTVSVELPNGEGLPSPLPPGTFHVIESSKEASGFLGKAHATPRDGRASLLLAATPGVKATQYRTLTRAPDGQARGQQVRISLANESDGPAAVTVVDFVGPDASVAENSHPFTEEKGRTFRFRIDLPPGRTRELAYEVQFGR